MGRGQGVNEQSLVMNRNAEEGNSFSRSTLPARLREQAGIAQESSGFLSQRQDKIAAGSLGPLHFKWK